MFFSEDNLSRNISRLLMSVLSSILLIILNIALLGIVWIYVIIFSILEVLSMWILISNKDCNKLSSSKKLHFFIAFIWVINIG